MNLEQILPENVQEVINQIKLSLESDLSNKNLDKDDAECYSFEIQPKQKAAYEDTYKFVVSIKKKSSTFFWIDTSKYELVVKVKRSGTSSYNWYDRDEFKVSDSKYSNSLSKIYQIIFDEFSRRDIEEKNKKMADYIDLIKTTVKPEVKRDESIEEILN